jgi:thymidylate synthase
MPDLRYMADLRNDYVFLVGWLARTGQRVESRGLATRELTGITLVFPGRTDAVLARPMLPVDVGRRTNTKLAALEALQLVAGEARSDLLKLAAPQFDDVLVKPDDPDYGAYGPRLVKQLSQAYTLLKRDPSTRRAVATIWEPRDLVHDGDRPCTLTFQFLIRNDVLELHVNMRSQDVWLGLTYDAFMFTQIQETLAARLGVGVGSYVHHVGSFHIYERDVERALTDLQTSAKLPPELPHGVIAPPDTTSTMVARRFLNNAASRAEKKLNPWYAQQIERLYADALKKASS